MYIWYTFAVALFFIHFYKPNNKIELWNMQRGSAKKKKSEIEREQMGQSEKQREIFIILKSYEIRLETDWKEAENPIKKTILCCCFMFLHEKFERKKKTFENTWNMPKASNQMNNDQQQQRKMVFLFGFFEKRENCFFFADQSSTIKLAAKKPENYFVFRLWRLCVEYDKTKNLYFSTHTKTTLRSAFTSHIL